MPENFPQMSRYANVRRTLVCRSFANQGHDKLKVRRTFQTFARLLDPLGVCYSEWFTGEGRFSQWDNK